MSMPASPFPSLPSGGGVVYSVSFVWLQMPVFGGVLVSNPGGRLKMGNFSRGAFRSTFSFILGLGALPLGFGGTLVILGSFFGRGFSMISMAPFGF